MFCVHCGKEIEDNSKFCVYCGKKVADSNVGKVMDTINKVTDTTNMKQDPKAEKKNMIIGLIVVCLAVILLFKGCGVIFGGGKYSSEISDAKNRISNDAFLKSTITGAKVGDFKAKVVSHDEDKCIIMVSYKQSGTRSGTNYILYFYENGEYVDSSGYYVQSKSELNIKEYEKEWY